MKKFICIILGLLYINPGSAGAQQAVHPVDRLRKEIRATHRRVGPLWWHPVVDLRLGFDSNPYQVGSVESEGDNLAGLDFRMETALLLGRLGVIRGSGSIGYQHYFRFDALRDTPRAWSVEGWLRVGLLGVAGGGVWTYRSYRYVVELDAPLRSDERQYYIRGELPMGRRLFLQGGYRYSVQRVEIPEAPALVAQNAFLDHTRRAVDASMGLRIGRSRVAIRFQRNWFRFDRVPDQEARDWSVGLAWTLEPGTRGQALVDVSYLHLTFADPRIPEYRGLATAVRLDVRVTRRLWLVLGVDRGPQWSVFGPVYYRDTGLSVQTGVSLFRSWRLRGGYRWRWQDYRPVKGTPAPGVDQRWRGWQVGLDKFSRRAMRFQITLRAWIRETAGPLVAQRRWVLDVIWHQE